ncbi:DUF302 domain-containing protein [Porphyromonas levii]|uniref:DUF302 domain-containing protein n=1 Tax=Porphyromonas levii TaxID=28114 RepID=A0A4Y8WSL9_9PORP|nr:DUF302 domain-containing protein [Porphyromonas levii]MBR8702812.1 hypothetical protein [Porphyromonas levii]MBR8712392.1 hypothetical protein [Porphyromonas levii]MBR8714437.1 hypothetical protein [Porphyromonas levii]MBR8726978.1 hypothetical protein [Porphyromonas levii]MBR8728859.1 hypothetical protein [Porphyromonas levii]
MIKDMFQESRSKYGFDETVEKLGEIISAKGWRITHTHDMQETMTKNGYSVLPIKVVELCNPVYASRMLSEDSLRIYSSLMPCRISIYEKSDGRTYVSRMNNGAMAGMIGGVVEEVMSGAYHDAEGFVAELSE